MTFPVRWTAPHFKGSEPTRVIERKAKKADGAKAEADAKRKVWARANGHCERCGKPVKKGVDSLTAGHVHHKTKRSHGGTWDPSNLILLCTLDHALVHSGRRAT